MCQCLLLLILLHFELDDFLFMVEKVVFGLSKIFICDPSRSLLVSLLIYKVFQAGLTLIVILLEPLIFIAFLIDFLLQSLALGCLFFYLSFHLSDLLLALAGVFLYLIHLFIEVLDGTFL